MQQVGVHPFAVKMQIVATRLGIVQAYAQSGLVCSNRSIGGALVIWLATAQNAQLVGWVSQAQPILRPLHLRITPRRIYPLPTLGAREAAGLAGADYYQGAHIDHFRGEFAEGEGAQGFAGAADIAAEDHQGFRRALLADDIQRTAELPGAGFGDGVVEGHH